jgi:hypothetical protein
MTNASPHRRGRLDEREEVPMRGKRLLLGGLGLLAALMMTGVALGVTVHTYFGPNGGAQWDFQYVSGYNNMAWNRVYRPTPKTFALFYGSGAQYAENRNDNPFLHNQSGGYTTASCADVDPYVHTGTSNVTCQYGA